MKDSVYIVTGGASGMGAATALVLAREGASVCVADINQDGAEQTAQTIAAAGGAVFATAMDVTNPDDNARTVQQTIERFGSLNGLHLNAGISAGSPIRDGDLDAWHALLNVNLTGPFLGLRAAAPHLKQGGSVVITASVAGLRGSVGSPGYIASKHGVIGLMKAAAAEFARDGIRVNAVCPGVIQTPMIGDHDQAVLDGPLANMAPLRRIGQPEEVGELVAFLLSDKSKFITGQAYAIDGGMTQVLAEAEAFPPQAQTMSDIILEAGK